MSPFRSSVPVWLLAGFGLAACAGTPELRAARPEPAITVDGAYDDWAGRFTTLGSERSVGLSVANDAGQLYVCLVTRNLEIGGLLQRAGFTLWLDPRAGSRRALGLRVGPVTPEPGQAVTPAVEVLFDGAEYGYQLAELTPQGPIDVRSAARGDVVVYEIRLAIGRPLTEALGRREAVTLSRTPVLGLGIEAEPLPLPAAAEGSEGPRARRERHVVEPLRIWVNVALVDPA